MSIIPNPKTVLRATIKAKTKWRFLLTELDVDESIIEDIGTRWEDSDECLRKGLSEWMKGGERRWSEVVDALSSPTVDRQDLADEIESKYLQSSGETSTIGEDSQENDQHEDVDYQVIRHDLKINRKKVLGSGAFGTVFEGLHREFLCAVKVLNHVAVGMRADLPPGPGQTEAVNAFDRECDCLESFKHENIVKYLTRARHPKSKDNILVTELMDCTLSDYLPNRSSPLTIEGEITLSQNIAVGLAYIHSKNILHRDLCGDNVLLIQKPTQTLPIAKISDFGMSRLIDPAQMTHSLTGLGHRRAYLPTEAARQEEEQYDQSIDVFSMGVIMVQIISRVGNVTGPKDRAELLRQSWNSHPLKRFIKPCLNENSSKRPTAKDVGTYLQDALEGEVKFKEKQGPHRTSTTQHGPKMPIKMNYPHSVVIGDDVFVGGGYDTANFTDSCTVMKFHRRQWTKLPEYRAQRFAMTSLNNQLVLVGGKEKETKNATNKIAVLESNKWKHPHPDMKYSRYCSSAVSFNNHIIVAGGIGDPPLSLANVEVFDVESRRWCIAKQLPKPSFPIKTVVLRDTIYVFGGDFMGNPQKSALKANLSQLICAACSETQRITTSLWQEVQQAPCFGSAPLTVGDSLLAVGGRDDQKRESSLIYLYRPDTNHWVQFGHLRTARFQCACSVLPSGEIIIVGGQGLDALNSMEMFRTST